jgi:hypothetical protein
MSTVIPAAAATGGRVSSRTFQTLPPDHRFFSIMSIIMSLAIVGGFSNTYVPKVISGTPVPPIIHLHAVVFATWLAIFVAQTTLVLNGKTAIHRKLGTAAVVFAALMVIVGTATAITVARLGDRGIPGVEYPDREGFLLLNLGVVVLFAVLVGAGWYFRRNLQAHKRLMLIANAGALVGPGVSRLPGVYGHAAAVGPLVLLFLFAGPVYDLVTRRRIHPAYFSVLLALGAIPPVVQMVAATETWHRIAALML